MNHASALREILSTPTHSRLDFNTAHELLGTILDGGLPDLELGAWLAALERSAIDTDAWLGMMQALEARISRPDGGEFTHRAVLLPALNAEREMLLPVLARQLARYDIPVLLHGPLTGSSGRLLRALDLMPARRWDDIEKSLKETRFAFAPTALFSQALAGLLALRERIGASLIARRLVSLLDPYPGHSLRVLGLETESDPALEELLRALGANALLLHNNDGMVCAGSHYRPAMSLFRDGVPEELFPPAGDRRPDVDIQLSPARLSAMIDGSHPLPPPLTNQIACCLHGAGFCGDFNQAKAITAMQNLLRRREPDVGAAAVHASHPPHR
jgi:anthranilate phosphoribosyltransferase